ncbi:MAG: M20/M25/M40 family metallo-hydrolase [Pseudomonadota bacterium]|nr:M20/M25/M40 family metallo-hydrolase [Pseudomonadota bacterium]
MHRILLAASLCFSGLASALDPAPAPFTADQIATAIALREQALRGSGAFAIVESLTTEVGQRMAGSEADARAVRWAEAKFKALGFDRVILQPVTFPVWKRGRESARIVAPAPQSLAVTALGWSSATPKGGLRSEVVGFANFDALKAADPLTLRGKIAYVSHAMRKRRNGGDYSHAVGVRVEGAAIAAAKGARALLIRSIGTGSQRFPHTGVALSARLTAKDPEAMTRATKLSDGSFIALTAVPAAALSVPDADQVERLLRLGKPVEIELVIEAALAGEYTSHNVIGEITGRELPQEIVVIGGHLDSWDLGTGAIDDGAGVAITMAAGAIIAQSAQRPRRTVRVVAFANEEQGVFGGRAYAVANTPAQHVAAAESDFGAGRIYRFDSHVAESQLPAIRQILGVLDPLGIESGSNDSGGGPDVSPLHALGVPMFELLQDGTDYFDLHHTANDTLDKIDPAALDQNVAAYAVFAWMSADLEQRFTVPAVQP